MSLPAIRRDRENGYGDGVEAANTDGSDMQRSMDRMAARLDAQQSKIDALSKALLAEETARSKLQSIVEQRGGGVGDGGGDESAVAALEAKVNHLYRMLKEKDGTGGSKEEKTGDKSGASAHKVANLIRDFEVLHSSSASIMSLVGALQSHLAEERAHRLSGQQEIREVVSAEITARRKNQTKVQSMLEHCTNRQEEDSAAFRRESLLLADHLDGRIRTVEVSITSLATSLYQELRDIREYTRDSVAKTREEIGIIRSFAEATSTAGLAAEIEARMTENFEHLVSHTNTQVSQLEEKSKQSFLGLLNTFSGLNAETQHVKHELSKETQLRAHGDKLLQNIINGVSSAQISSASVAASVHVGSVNVSAVPPSHAAPQDDLPSPDDPEANLAATRLQARVRGSAARKAVDVKKTGAPLTEL